MGQNSQTSLPLALAPCRGCTLKTGRSWHLSAHSSLEACLCSWSLLADGTLRPRAPWNRNQRTENLEAAVGLRLDSGLDISGDQPWISCFGVKSPRGSSTSQVTFLPVPLTGNCNLRWHRTSWECAYLPCPPWLLFTAHLVLLLGGLAEQPFKTIPASLACCYAVGS